MYVFNPRALRLPGLQTEHFIHILDINKFFSDVIRYNRLKCMLHKIKSIT